MCMNNVAMLNRQAMSHKIIKAPSGFETSQLSIISMEFSLDG